MSEEVALRAMEIEEDMIRLEEELVYESDVDMSSNIPKIGRFYMFLTTEVSGKSRYWISPLNKSSTFTFKERQVNTRAGIAEGLACPIVCKRVGAAPDYRSGKIVGVYQILNTPTFARAGIKVQELRDALKKEDIVNLIKVHTYNIALRLKGLLQEQRIINLSLMKKLGDIEIDVVQVGGEIANTAISLERAGSESASKQLRRAAEPSAVKWLKNNWQVLAVIGVGILLFWWLFTPH